MKSLRQSAAVPTANRAPQVPAKAGKQSPTPLSEAALKQVAGGNSTATPQKNW